MEHDKKKKSLTKIAINTLVGSFTAVSCMISLINSAFDKNDQVTSHDQSHLKFENIDSHSLLLLSKGIRIRSHVNFKSGQLCNDFRRLGNIFIFPIASYSQSCRSLTEGDIEDLQERFPNEMKGVTARFIPTQMVTLP